MMGVDREVAAKKILDQGKVIYELNGIELTTLLIWNEVSKPGEGKVDGRREIWRRIFDIGKDSPPTRSGQHRMKLHF